MTIILWCSIRYPSSFQIFVLQCLSCSMRPRSKSRKNLCALICYCYDAISGLFDCGPYMILGYLQSQDALSDQQMITHASPFSSICLWPGALLMWHADWSLSSTTFNTITFSASCSRTKLTAKIRHMCRIVTWQKNKHQTSQTKVTNNSEKRFVCYYNVFGVLRECSTTLLWSTWRLYQ